VLQLNFLKNILFDKLYFETILYALICIKIMFLQAVNLSDYFFGNFIQWFFLMFLDKNGVISHHNNIIVIFVFQKI